MEKIKVKVNKLFDTELLIELVKSQPPLYNSTLKVYRCKSICDELWKEISGVMQKEVRECRSVWSSLRSAYARHLQNIRNNESGTHRKKKHWYLADKMAFLYNYMQITPHDRRLYQKPNKRNKKKSMSADDNSTSFSNLEYKSENCDLDDNSLTMISEASSENPLLPQDETTNEADSSMRLNETETADSDANCSMKMSQIELNTQDTNMLTPERNQREKEPPIAWVPETPITRTTPAEPILMGREEIIKSRQDSAMMFFQSILFDVRNLSDRRLRLFKQDVLKDLNKHLDEDDNED